MGACCLAKKKETNKPTMDSRLLKVISRENIHNFYELGENIGVGQFGSVYRAVKKNVNTSIKFAIKSIPKAKVGQKIELLERELTLQMQVNHPNIVKVYEIFEDEEYLHIVMEHCSGGELFEQLTAKKRYTESEAANILYTLLHAISHLHSLSISHRDLKPENVLFASRKEDAEIKLIDFGFAKLLSESEASTNTIVGSPYYIAPEVLDQNYGVSCDIWSLGVILYILLIGKPPFSGDNPKTILQKVINGIYEQGGPEWDELSQSAQDLIRKMLCTNFRERISAGLALEHPWFKTRKLKNPRKIEKKVLNRLRQAENYNKFQRETINILARCLKKKEVGELNRIFRALDRDHTGKISAEELKEGLTRSGFELSPEEITQIMNYVGQPGSGKIDYSQFLSAALDRKVLLNKNAMWMAFKVFDADNSGHISKENLRNALVKGGWTISDEEIDSIMRATGEFIDFETFSNLFAHYPIVENEASNSSMMSETNRV